MEYTCKHKAFGGAYSAYQYGIDEPPEWVPKITLSRHIGTAEFHTKDTDGTILAVPLKVRNYILMRSDGYIQVVSERCFEDDFEKFDDINYT